MLNKEEIEKAKEILNKFINNEIQRDKLERDNRCGGWKIGDVYKHLELNPSIKTLLQYIDQLEQENDKQNKIIDLMAISINSYDSQLDICQYSNKEEVKQNYEEYFEQYFEKKVEKKQMEKDYQIQTSITINGEIEDISAMLVGAVRYALGRRTYIVQWTCEFIRNNTQLLIEKDKKVIIRDIEQQKQYSYGDKCDEECWLALLDYLKKMNSSEQN